MSILKHYWHAVLAAMILMGDAVWQKIHTIHLQTQSLLWLEFLGVWGFALLTWFLAWRLWRQLWRSARKQTPQNFSTSGESK